MPLPLRSRSSSGMSSDGGHLMRAMQGLAAIAAFAGCSNEIDFETVSSAVEAGAPPTPVYQRIRLDAITSDDIPVVVTVGGAPCPISAPCYVADPDADSYSEDQFERPAGQGSLASTVVPSIDL